jgi:hypothetical protein
MSLSMSFQNSAVIRLSMTRLPEIYIAEDSRVQTEYMLR